jgi:hypothetical protein
MNDFYREYRLLKNLPQLPVETLLKWNCWREEYSDIGDWIGLNPPKAKVAYSRDEIVSAPDWFEPVGEAGEFYPKFPSQREFFDRENGHFSGGETRHNDMCRICQLLHKLDTSKEMEEAIYQAYKTAYEAKFN